MKAVDTSVIVAGFASWHGGHAAASRILDREPSLIAHCALETYSVLTRLPVPHRVAPEMVARLLVAAFGDAPLVAPAGLLRDLPAELANLGIAGGAAYDALVAATARHHGATLITLDGRALPTYRKIGVAVEILDPTS